MEEEDKREVSEINMNFEKIKKDLRKRINLTLEEIRKDGQH